MKQQRGSGSEKSNSQNKTNVMRILEQNGITHRSYFYGDGEAASGTEVAEMLGEDPDRVFKTLVTAGHSGEHYVFMVPVRCELDLKKGAAAVIPAEIIHTETSGTVRRLPTKDIRFTSPNVTIITGSVNADAHKQVAIISKK